MDGNTVLERTRTVGQEHVDDVEFPFGHNVQSMAGSAGGDPGVQEPGTPAETVPLESQDVPPWWLPAESTNRPGANRHGSEDTIDLGWLVQWNESRFSPLIKRYNQKLWMA